ncbi:hypothetical protein WJM97_07800 [Okeanomitos corallinicola TIOX110]|uniref:SPOR domain-containing protein n=1 Tax=Okeanomitos corallinicola TIOX110 TaxID=3133117 RepID=A0ABZ2UZ60_9CYAN
MPNLIKQRISNLPILSLFLGGCLVLIPHSSQAQQTLPNLYQIDPYQQTLQQLQPQPTQIVDFDTNNQIYQTNPTTQINQNQQNFDKYIVYIDSDNRGLLQRVKQIESTAYIREVNGKKIIQSGVFTRPDNAQRRVKELELNGITGAGIFGSSNSGQMSYYSDRVMPDYNYFYKNPNSSSFNSNNPSPNIVQKQANYYYVVIPTSLNNLNFLGQEIQQKIGGNANVFPRNQPRGTHIAVGAFRERSDAEQWNDYLKSLGYGNARVYYGK